MIKERYILVFFIIILSVGIVYRFLDSMGSNPKVVRSVEKSSFVSRDREKKDEKINLNTASFSDLLRLPGIGKVKAKAIMDYRERNNGFKSVREIMKVPGIGEKTFERIKEMIFVEGEDKTWDSREKRTNLLVNVNTSTLDELVKLPGIGEVKARAIIEYRTNHGPFRTVDELLKVKGIGRKTLERLRKYVTVGANE